MQAEEIWQKIEAAPPATVHVLGAAKAKRLGCKTLYIPSVLDVVATIRGIPKGQVSTIEDLRRSLAKSADAETACPSTTVKYWKWLAVLSSQPQAPTAYSIPWWRVLKDSKPSRHMPGGVGAQIALLRREGVVL